MDIKEAVISGMMAGAILGAFTLPSLVLPLAIIGAAAAAYAVYAGYA